MPAKKRLIIYVDGFNLYHGIDDLRDHKLKWLDLWKLAESLCADDEAVANVYYFSAYATWIPDAYKRHRDYVRALTSKNVTAVMGEFKKKSVTCHSCKARWDKHEEKETDVHIAVQIIHDAHEKNYDHAILITGDSDQAPTVKKAKAIHPQAKFSVWTPPGRIQGCHSLGTRFEIRRARIEKCQLEDRVLAADGSLLVERPVKYR
ncbi:MAG: NYN domain-containing protein [Alphaproteobacteria bacterium]|nr:NYN domain-containing protein [Alphaproteobacteria bacterium]